MNKRMAIVHEWVASRSGSEKVFERLAGLFPEADLYALTVEPGVKIDTGGRPIRTTAIDREWFRNHRALSLPLMPAAWRALGRRMSYDIVLSSSHAFSRYFFQRSQHGKHLSYTYAPMRYAWDRSVDARRRTILGGPAGAVLRAADRQTVDQVNSYAAISSEIADRLARHYGVEARVIHPPVDVDFFSGVHRAPDDYLLSFGRFIPYKRFDLAIEVAAMLRMRLVVAGSGPAEKYLRDLAKERRAEVEFVLQPSDEALRGLLSGARLLLFPGIEDFGIVPVEAQAAGVAVVGPNLGGLRDTVLDGVTGVLTASAEPSALATGVKQALTNGLGGTACRQWAARFSGARFDRELLDWVGANS